MPRFEKEWLQQELQSKSVKQIAEEQNVKQVAIYKAASNYKIPIKKIPPYQTREFLESVDLQNVTVYDLAQQFGVAVSTITGWFNKFQLPWKYEPWRDKQWCEQQLILHHGKISEIAKATGYNLYTLQQQIRHFGLRDPHAYAKYQLNEHYFDVIDNERKAYYLGFLMADGCLRKDCGNLSVDIQERDRKVLDSLKKDLNYNGPITVIEHKNKQNIAYLSINSITLCRGLIYHGIIPRKTGKECLPDTVPQNLIRHFIRGFIDGDGYIDSTKYLKIQIVSTSLNVLYSIKYYLEESLSQIRQYDVKEVTPKRKVKMYHYDTFGDSSMAILEHIYEDATIYLDRKHEAYMTAASLRKKSKK